MRTRRRLLSWMLGLVAVLAVVYGAAAYYFASLIIAFDPPTLSENRAEYAEGMLRGLGLPEPGEVSIPGTGVTLAAWLFEQPGPARCGVVLSHGRSGTRYGILKYAPLVWKRGCDIVAIDARYHGDSTGEYGTMGYHEKHDLVAVVDWLAQRLGLPRSRIGILGESMGAAITLQAAALLPDIGFVAADSPYSDLRTILSVEGGRQYGFLVDLLLSPAMVIAGWRAGADLDDVSPVRYAARIQAPVFLSHSRDDALIPWQHTEAVYAAIPHDRKVMHIVDWDAAHGQSVERRPDEYARLFHDFLDRHTTGF
jgi:dipeptidyl aminopeptidase/acylaminoacyl peptidase